MLNISSIAKAEKNKLHTDSAFIVLARIVPPASTGVSEICIAHNNEDIVWQGKLWQAFPFGIGDSKVDNTGSEPSIEFKVSNVSRTLTYLLEQAGGGTGSKVYIYVVNTAEIKGENQHSAGLADPTFTRASTAYDDSGSMVAANVPRMSGRGLLIEEGTTNLLTNPTLSNNGSGWTITNYSHCTPYTFTSVNGYNKICFTRDDTATGTDTMLGIKQSVNVTAGKSYNYSIYIEGTKGFLDRVVYQVSGSQTYLEIQWFQGTSYQNKAKASSSNLQRISDTLLFVNFSGTAPTNCTMAQFWCIFDAPNLLSGQYCNIYKPQLEAKSYATSYTDGTRAAEQFKIPIEAINPTAWTIEFDAQLNDIHNYNILFDSRGNTKGVKMALFAILGGAVQLQYYTDATTWAGVNTAIAVPDKLKHHYKISYDGSNINLYFDGVLKKTVTDVTLYNGTASVTNYLNVGFSGDGYYLDGYISNIRISNVCRPDNDTTPAVDANTTYYMPLTDNLNFTADAELEEQYAVGKTSVDENWVTFTLGAGYSLRTRRPFYRYMKNSCPFKYKGTRCACTSSEATCRHTLADCRARGNSKRYGGFPGIDQKGLYLE